MFLDRKFEIGNCSFSFLYFEVYLNLSPDGAKWQKKPLAGFPSEVVNFTISKTNAHEEIYGLAINKNWPIP